MKNSERTWLSVGLGILCVVALFISLTSRNGSGNALAVINVAGSYNVRYRLNAVIELPAAKSNESWTSNWLMLVQRGENEGDPPFVQVGLIRDPKWSNRPFAFSAYALPQHGLVYVRGKSLAEGKHTASIRGTASTISLAIDGSSIQSFRRRDFFLKKDILSFDFGSEVAASGDRATGSISDVFVLGDHDRKPWQILRKCLRTDRGISLGGKGDYLASGIRDPYKIAFSTHC